MPRSTAYWLPSLSPASFSGCRSSARYRHSCSEVLSGLLGIIWIVVAATFLYWIVVSAMFLYTLTVITGQFEIVKESIVHISFDRRPQVLLIALSFGAIIEGTSGFGTPVAIAGAVMVGLVTQQK